MVGNKRKMEVVIKQNEFLSLTDTAYLQKYFTLNYMQLSIYITQRHTLLLHIIYRAAQYKDIKLY